MPRPLTRNAADEKQVNFARRKAQQAEDRYRDSLRAILQSREGRIVCWGILNLAGIYKTVMPAAGEAGSLIYYNAGKQAIGLEFLDHLIAADERAYELMEREMRAFQRGEDRETAAVQVDPTEE